MPGVKATASLVFFVSLVTGCSTYHTTDAVADQAELNRYLQHLWNKIEIIADARYPDLQQRIKQHSQIEVAMYLSQQGELLQIDLIQSSGDASLDAALLDILTYAAPHPPLPPQWRVEVLKISKTWTFVPAD